MSAADFDSVDGESSGAIPTLTGESSDPVLGAPTTRTKSRSNVTKFFFLVIIVLAFLMLMVGALWFFKMRGASASKPTEVKISATEKKNEALESSSIERRKRELAAAAAASKAAEDEARRIKEAEAKSTAVPAAPGTGRAVSSSAPAGPVAPPEMTPDERRRLGNVLVSPASAAFGAAPGASNGQGGEPATAATPPGLPAHLQGLIPQGGGGAGGFGAPTQGDSISARLEPTVLAGRSAGRLPDLDYLLKRGTTIPCALKTGIDTTLPGFVICIAMKDVYSANSKTLLIERGASIFGEQQSTLKQGQERTFVLWTRIDNPSGVFAQLDSPAVDAMGYNGISGYVDTHFWKRFGGAIMLSFIRDFSQTLTTRQSSGGNGATYNNSQQATENMAAEALRNSINIPPTLYVLPATVVNVMVARDVSFKNVYELVK